MDEVVDGQRRNKGGRPKHVPPLKKICVNLTEEQMKWLRMVGRGDLSAGLRWLIAAAAPLVRRADTDRPHNS